MPALVLDEIKGAELELTALTGSYIRTGHIDGIDLANTPDPDALVKVLPYLPAIFSPLGPLSPGLKLARIRIKPSEQKIRRCDLELIYETTIANFTPTVYLLRDRSYSAQETRSTIPGSRIPLRMGFGNPLATNDDADDTNLIPDAFFLNFNITVRAIQLTVLQYARPTAGAQDFTNYVNDASWPTGDVTFPVFQSNIGAGGGVTNMKTASAKPLGYWRLGAYATEYDRNRGMTLVQAEAITKGLEDWSQVATLRSAKTGKFPFFGLADATRASVLADMNGRNYSYGYIYPLGIISQFYGISRIGGYPLCSFPGIFGF
jgi:hypothetical protein